MHTEWGRLRGVLFIALPLFIVFLGSVNCVTAEQTDVSQLFSVMVANEHSTVDWSTGNLISTSDVTLTNTSNQNIPFPIDAVIEILDTDYANVKMPGALGGPEEEPYHKYYFERNAVSIDQFHSDFGKTACTGCAGDMDGDGDVDGIDLALVARGQNSLPPGGKITFHLTFVRPETVRFRYNVIPYANIQVGPVNHPPVANAGGPYAGIVEEDISFDGSGCSDPDNDPLYYHWDFGDGASSTERSPVHAYASAGQYTVRLTVSDGKSGTDTAEVVVVVSRLNHPPVIAPIGEQAVKEGMALSFQVQASDEDGDTLTYSGESLPAGASIDPASGVFSWTPGYDQAGAYTVVVKATDPGGLSASVQVPITVENVDRPPHFAPVSAQSIQETKTLAFRIDAQDPDQDTLVFSAPSIPPGAAFDPSSRGFTWTPPKGYIGTYYATFSVTDGQLTDTLSVPITVIPFEENASPVFATLPDQTVAEGSLLSFQVVATDPNNDPLTYGVSGVPEGASFDPATRTFSWTPGYDQAGTYWLHFMVSDPSGLSDYKDVRVTVTNINRPPQLAPIGPKRIQETKTLAFTVQATDPDNDPLVYSCVGLPQGASLDPSTGAFSFTPTEEQAGVYDVDFTVSDGELQDTAHVEITVLEYSEGDSPTINPIADQNINEGELLSLEVIATDPNGDELTYSASGLPQGAQFDPTAHTFTWPPDFDQSGEYNIVFTVTDPGGLSDAASVHITVNNVNRSPSLEPIAAQSVNEGEPLSFTLSATDPDGDALVYSGVDLPGGASIDPSSGIFTWTPGFDQAGSYTVTVSVTDGELSASQPVSITVTDVNRPPTITTTELPPAAIDQGYRVKIEAQDPDGDPLTYTLAQAGAAISLDGQSGVITWRPGISDIGSYPVTVSVDDGKGGVASKDYIIVVPDTVNPSVLINAPKEGNPGTSFNAHVVASDNAGIGLLMIEGETVQFSQPYPKDVVQERSITLPSKIGSFSIHATAIDPSGNRTESEATIQVVASFDKTPPQVEIKVPPTAYAGQNIQVTAKVHDDKGVASVTFYADGAPIGTPPPVFPSVSYTVPEDLAQGEKISFSVEAKDFSGNTATDEASTTVVTIEQADTQAPEPDISTPEQTEPNAPIPVDVNVPNETCLSRIDIYVNHTLAATYFSPDASRFEFPTPAGVEPGMDVLVDVVVTDCSGNQTKVASDLVSIEKPGSGLIAGQVYDDTTGLPVKGATVVLFQGQTAVGSTETDELGRFSLSADAGAVRIRVSKDGFTAVERVGIEIPEDSGIEMLDARLTPISQQSVSIIPELGGQLACEFSPVRAGLVPAMERMGMDPATVGTQQTTFNIPAGALTQKRDFTITQISPQGLEGLIPAGWSPVGVVDILPHGVSFNIPGQLSIPNLLGINPARTLALVRWDEEAHAWRVASLGAVSNDNSTLTGDVDSTGQLAIVLADTSPQVPPSPGVGDLLLGIARQTLPEDVTTTITPQPKVIFYRPGVHSDVGMVASSATGPLSSGIPCLAVINEEYDFYSGDRIVTGPIVQDIFLYSMGLDALTAAWPVTPSREFGALTLEKGIIDVAAVGPESPERGLRTVGPEGGSISVSTGESISIPPEAVSEPIPVDVEPIKPDSPSIFVPEGFTFVGALLVSFGDAELNKPAAVSVPLPDGISPDGQFVLVKMVDTRFRTEAVLVDRATVEDKTVTSAYTVGPEGQVEMPGVTTGGRYMMLKAENPVSFATGTVFDPQGNPKPGALVTAQSLGVASLSGTDGIYVAGVPVGSFTISALDLEKLDSGQAQGLAGQMGELVEVDVSLKAEPPRVVEVRPENGSSNVPLETSIQITFSEPVSPETVTESSVVLTGPDGPVAGTISLGAGNTQVIFRPAGPLEPNTTYTITALTQIEDLAGYGLESPFSSSFTSLDTLPPPPPPAGSINATIPREEGTTTVTATQGTAGVHDTVVVVNKTKNISKPALVQPDGSFSTTIEADWTDDIVISITDSAGNETVVPVGPFKDPDGSTLIGPEGGILDAENGVVVEIPEGAFPRGGIVKLTALSESDIPVSPGPDFPFVAAFEIETSEYPTKYFNVSAPLPSPDTEATTGIVARLVHLYGGEPHLAIVDTAKVKGGRLVTSSPPCPGLKGYYRQVYIMYMNMAENMIKSYAKLSFSVISAAGGGLWGLTKLTASIIKQLYDSTQAAIEIYKNDMTGLYPFVAAINGLDPYACMVIPPEEGFKAVIRNPETREVIDYIDIDPIEPFGHAHFDFSVYKKNDVFGPKLASIEPVSKVLDPVDPRITLRFSEPVDHMALLGAGEKDIYLTLKDNESIYFTGTWELKEDNTVLVFKPHYRLPMGKTFVLHLENIRDLVGNSYDGPDIEIKTYAPKIIFPSTEIQLTRSKIAQDLGVSIDQVPDELWLGDLDYSTRGPEVSYDGHWHTDIVAIQYPDYEKSGWNTYRLFKIDATDPLHPMVSGGFKTDTRYTQTRVRFLDDVLIPPRPDFQGEPWWKRKVLVYNSEDPSIKYCWDPQGGDQEEYNEWASRHCDPSCDQIEGGCGDLAVVTGYSTTSASGTSYSMLFPYEVADPGNISWIGWRFLSDAGYGFTTRSDVPVGVGYPLGVVVVPGMDITHGDQVHSNTVGAFVANYGIGLQLVDLGLNMPGIGDEERKNQSLTWAPIERLHMINGHYYKDVVLVPNRITKDGTQVPPRIVALAHDQTSSSVMALEIYIPGQGDKPTGTKSLSRAPQHLAIASNIPVKNYETNKTEYRDLAVVTFTADTGGGVLICEIPDNGSSPAKAQYLLIPVGTKFVDVDSRAQLAYVGASGIDETTGGDGILIVDISDPFTCVGDKDGDGWDDRVIAKIPLTAPPYAGPVSSWGLRADPERGLVYAAIYAGGEQGLAIIKVRDCPDPGVDFKEVRASVSLPEDVIKKGIEQIIRYALSGSGIPEDSVAVVAYGDGACVFKGQCDPFAEPDNIPYRFAILIPEAQWDKKDLLINTLYAQVRDDVTGGPKKVTLEGSDVFVTYKDIEFIPVKLEEFVNADLSLDYNKFDYGLAHQTQLLEILLTGTYLDNIPGVNSAVIPLDIILSNLTSTCPEEECGTLEPSHIWRQEGYEVAKLALARFLEKGLLIRVHGETERGTSLRSAWKKDLRDAASLALRAALGHMIATEDGNRFIAFRADTYGFSDTGVLVSSGTDPTQWDYSASIESFEHWIATMAALSVRDNVGVFLPEDIVSNIFEFLEVFNGEKIFASEDEANAFIAKCYNFIQAQLNGLPWSVYQARLQDDPRASQRTSNMSEAEGAIIDFSNNGKKNLNPRFFNKGAGSGSHISVKMYEHAGGTWEQAKEKEVDLDSGSELMLPNGTFQVTGLNQNDPSSSAGWIGFTIDLPERKMRDGNLSNNWINIYYYVIDPANPARPELPADPGLPVENTTGDLLDPVPECTCKGPVIKLAASVNGREGAQLEPGECADIDVGIENTGTEALSSISIKTNLPGFEDWSYEIASLAPGASENTPVHFCAPQELGGYRASFWFEENDPDYNPSPAYSQPLEISVVKARLHVDGKANSKDEVFVAPREDISFSVVFGDQDPQDADVIWDLGDGKGMQTARSFTYSYEKPGTYWATVFATSSDGSSGKDTVVVHVVELEILVNETLDDPVLVKDPGEIDDLVRLKAEFPDAEDPAILPTKVFFTPCLVRLKTPLAKAVPITLEAYQGKIGFAKQEDSTMQQGEHSLNLIVPKNGDPATFFITGEQPSAEVDDARVLAWNRDKTSLFTSEDLTVFWFDNIRMEVVQGGVYQLTPITEGDYKGWLLFEPQGSGTDSLGVLMKASATIEPDGIPCNAPQVARIRLGIVQNASGWVDIHEYSEPKPNPNPDASSVDVPETVTETVTYEGIQPTQWLCDSSAENSPLYHKCVKLSVGCDECSYDRPYLLNRPPAPCPGSGFEFNGISTIGVWNDDTPYSIVFPRYPAEGFLNVPSPDGSTVVEYRYEKVRIIRREKFRCWAVTIAREDGDWSSCDQCSPCSRQEDVIPLMENGWELDLDSNAVDASGQPDPAKRRAQVLSATGFLPRHAPVIGSPFPNKTPKKKVIQFSSQTTTINP